DAHLFQRSDDGLVEVAACAAHVVDPARHEASGWSAKADDRAVLGEYATDLLAIHAELSQVAGIRLVALVAAGVGRRDQHVDAGSLHEFTHPAPTAVSFGQG